MEALTGGTGTEERAWAFLVVAWSVYFLAKALAATHDIDLADTKVRAT